MVEQIEKGSPIGIRHLQSFLLFSGIIVNYFCRQNVSLALVAITHSGSTNPNFPEYNWTEAEKSYILSSFYWSYLLTQFPGGLLSRCFGVKLVFLVATFGTGLLTVITPNCISWGGWQAYCGIRILQGLLQGMIPPCVHEHVAKWSPPEERNRIGAFSYSGIDCGIILSMGLSGVIAKSSLGWPGIYYISAGMCFIWCVLWLIFASNNVQDAKFISETETKYILSSMQNANGGQAQKLPVPWRAILTSAPFYAVLITRCTQSWGNSILQLQIPAYIHDILKMEIDKNALYSVLPFLAMWICSYIYLFSAEILRSKNWFSLSVLRKSINTLATWGPAAGLIAAGFLNTKNTSLILILLTVSIAITSGQTIGSVLNTIDLSRNHAGILMAVINAAGNVLSLLSPLIVGIIITDTSSRLEWQIVFTLTAITFFFGNLIYIIWGKTDTQPWNAENYLEQKKNEPTVEITKF